jgi:hypothetical protein
MVFHRLLEIPLALGQAELVCIVAGSDVIRYINDSTSARILRDILSPEIRPSIH